ncbi:MAG: YybH family protein [Bacteroidota bacterium]|jgi:ketosteroid isomerase-like protein
MKKLYLILLPFILINFNFYAQDAETEIKHVINDLFDGMRNADSVKILSLFAKDAFMQSVSKNKEGQTMVKRDEVAGFASFVGKQKKGVADEQIVFESIKIDGDLAFAWTPYTFIYNGTYSHRGVDAFCLVKLDGKWKIQYLIDTRRK